MAEPHVLTILVAKRAELAGEIVAAEKRLDQMRADLVPLDGAVRLFGGPAPETIAANPVRTRYAWFGNGELPRWVLDALRKAPAPLAAGDLAQAVMAAKGLDAGDRVILERVTKLIHRSLRAQEARGLAETAGSKAVLWRVVG